LKSPRSKRLKLCDIPLSTSAFKFNLRRYTTEDAIALINQDLIDDGYDCFASGIDGRSLYSSTFQVNLSAVYDTWGARLGCPAHVKGVLGGI